MLGSSIVLGSYITLGPYIMLGPYMILGPDTILGSHRYQVSPDTWVTAPYETRTAPLLLYAGFASGRAEVPRSRLGQEG